MHFNVHYVFTFFSPTRFFRHCGYFQVDITRIKKYSVVSSVVSTPKKLKITLISIKILYNVNID